MENGRIWRFGEFGDCGVFFWSPPKKMFFARTFLVLIDYTETKKQI